jgi:hypothetical protein
MMTDHTTRQGFGRAATTSMAMADTSISDHATGTKASTLSATDWLALAATPTFAIMALLTGFLGSEPGLLCLSAHDASPLSGMLAMYLLMSAFHSAPWFKLVFNR